MAVVDLTTLARLKQFAELPASRTDSDVVLGAIISAVSSTIENNLNRTLAIESKTERRQMPRTGKFVILNGPATAITQVRYSSDGMFSSGASVVDPSLYEIDPSGDVLNIRGMSSFWGDVEVTYTGGLVEDAEDCAARFPDLEMAALMQAAHLWKRHLTLGRTSTDIGNGATTWSGDYDLLPGVVAILVKYRRPWAFM